MNINSFVCRQKFWHDASHSGHLPSMTQHGIPMWVSRGGRWPDWWNRQFDASQLVTNRAKQNLVIQAPETPQVFMTCVQTQNLRKIRKNVFNPACTVCEKDPVDDCEKYVNYARSARTAETA